MTESELVTEETRVNKARLEFLVDGIFAIAMTLLHTLDRGSYLC